MSKGLLSQSSTTKREGEDAVLERLDQIVTAY